MRTLTVQEKESKRQERNRQKTEQRRALREIQDFLAGTNGPDAPGRLKAAVAQIAPAGEATIDEARVRALVEDAIAKTNGNGQAHHITITIDDVTREIEGKVHRMFDPLLRLCRGRKRDGSRNNVLIVGPAGCGKSHAAKQVAEALELSYGFISLSAGISESHLIGRFIPSGDNGRFEYREAPFVKFYRDGGVFCLDEVDAADENVLLVINGALANGHLRLPDGTTVARHADFVCIACANTFGNGADRQYVGRNQLDAATLDRFVAARLQFDYDTIFEKSVARPDVCRWAQKLRERVERAQLRRVVSTRFILDASDLIDSKAATLDEVKRSLLLDWTDSELSSIEEVRP